MIRRIYYTVIPVLLGAAIVVTGCGTDAGGRSGDRTVMTIGGAEYGMVFVPGKTFPTGTSDRGTATVGAAFLLGETEITYDLWQSIHAWATDEARGDKRYYFQNPGVMGDGEGDSGAHPVTCVNWRDAIVWTNAATEWRKAMQNTTDECVYTAAGAEIRDSRDANAVACDNAVINQTAKGFRLAHQNEWELAARWSNTEANTVPGYADPWFSKGTAASGAGAAWQDTAALHAVAVFDSDSAAPVRTKAPNALGLYDMSGNVWEWTNGLTGYYRVGMGGCWSSTAASSLFQAYVFGLSAGNTTPVIGFRLAKAAS